MIKSLIILAAMIGGSVLLENSLSQQTNRVDFPQDQVEQANKELDSFLKSLPYPVPFKLTNEHRNTILNKYLGQTDRSPFFWEYLESLFSASYRPIDLCRTCGMVWVIFLNEEQREDFVVSRIKAESWGVLILSSRPSGADVLLQSYSIPRERPFGSSGGSTKEGRTIIRRKYPEGRYTFVLKMDGFKDKETTVNINKDNPTEENVTLEKK